MLGLSVLQIMSEEFISPREDLNTVRKQELRTLLLEQAEGTLSRVMAILDAVMQKSRSTTNTSTPPPSPNRHSPFTSPSSSPSHNGNSSPFQGATGVSQKSWLPSHSLQQDKLITTPTLDVASEEIVISALGCLNQFFTWMPLSRVLSPVLISKFFLFAAYGCSGLSNGTSDHKSNEIGQLIFSAHWVLFFSQINRFLTVQSAIISQLFYCCLIQWWHHKGAGGLVSPPHLAKISFLIRPTSMRKC